MKSTTKKDNNQKVIKSPLRELIIKDEIELSRNRHYIQS